MSYSPPQESGAAVRALRGWRRRPKSRISWEATVVHDRGRRDFVLRRALAVADVVAVSIALLAAFAVTGIRGIGETAWLLPALPAWVALFGVYGGYGRASRRISHSGLDDLQWMFHALLLGSLGLWVYFRLLPVHQLVFLEMALFGAGSLVSLLCLRWVAKRVVQAALGAERVLLIGDAPVSSALVSKVRMHPEYGIDLVGMVSRGGHPGPAGLPVLGSLDDPMIGKLIEEHNVEHLLVSQAEVDEQSVLELLRLCGPQNLKVSLLPPRLLAMGPSVEVDSIEGVTVLGLKPLVLPRSARIAKRAVDVVGATAGLLLLALPMALIALAIKLDSKGPVLFKQRRMGRHGATFSLLKFRTMVTDAEGLTAELRARSSDPNWLKLERDPRITRVGRFLRMTSLDELPQLWNVLVGQMSLVGPRPIVPDEHDRVSEWARARLDLAPGITGLWQVLGRTNIPFEEMGKLDYVYVTNWSLWTDIKLLIQTVPAVLRQRGAN